MGDKVLVSVASAYLRDPSTGEGLAYGTANIDSAFTVTTQQTEVRGGVGNKLIFNYIHDRKIDCKITEATFAKSIMSLNAGANIVNGTITALKTDCVMLSASGSATLNETPTSSTVSVFYGEQVQTVIPVGDVITVSGWENLRVDAMYDYSVAADQITFEATKPPSIVDLVLIAEERDADSRDIANYIQIHVPQFQITGNYSLTMAANGVSNQALEGTSLSVKSSDCTTGDYYAKVSWIPYDGVAPSVTSLAAVPAVLTFSAASVPQSKQISLKGLRGGLYGNVDVTTSASFLVTSGSTTAAGNYNVGLHTGLVTAGSSVAAGWLATVTASYVDPTAGLLNETISVIATA